MDMRFGSVGMHHMVQINRVVTIMTPNTVSAKNYINEARKSNKLIDASLGRRNRSLVIMDEGTVIISCIKPETLCNRFNDRMIPTDQEIDAEDYLDPEEVFE